MYDLFIEQIFESFDVMDQIKTFTKHIDLFIEFCSVPRPGEATNVMSRARKVAFVPREVIERQKLRLKSVQNGSVVMAHLILAKNPNLIRIELEYLSKLDEADILSSFLYLINFLATNFVEVRRPASSDGSSGARQIE